ncbi:DUF1707 domain-containing protein [Streptomyces pathocidini]|uniref:DUF1707 domain-containing protein n=1 Tax=Streptomyces pathocidini TaxID=1650571 RepID=A0ABW7UQT3_9ACTN
MDEPRQQPVSLTKPPVAAPAVAAPAPAVAAAEIRASDADRDRFADILREALAEGRLTADEHAERIDRVYRAKTVGELEPLVRDLPAVSGAHPRPAYAATLSGAPDADENLVAIFSASTRRGRWRIARRTHAFAFFGSVEIDLTEALFEHPEVHVRATSIFGSVEIRLPENITLRGSGTGIFGSVEVETQESADPRAPVVVVSGHAVFGSIEARPKRGHFLEDLHARINERVNRHMRKHLGG